MGSKQGSSGGQRLSGLLSAPTTHEERASGAEHEAQAIVRETKREQRRARLESAKDCLVEQTRALAEAERRQKEVIKASKDTLEQTLQLQLQDARARLATAERKMIGLVLLCAVLVVALLMVLRPCSQSVFP